MPFSLPVGHPAGFASVASRLRLWPFGPDTKIKNVFPALADPKLKSASTSVGLNTTNLVALTRLFGFPSSTANTDVTFVIGPPCPASLGIMKQNPEINRSCGLPQSAGPLGVADITTGALNPRSTWHVAVNTSGVDPV